MASAEVIKPALSGGICVSSLLSGHCPIKDEALRLRPVLNSCHHEELGCKINIHSIVNPRCVEQPTIRLPSVRSFLLTPETIACSFRLPPIPDSPLMTRQGCPPPQDRLSSPSPSSSSCATEVQWPRCSQTDSTNASTYSSHSASCDDKVCQIQSPFNYA
jgi:hypothetical protein